MTFDFKVIGHPLTSPELDAFEAGAKLRLPPQYRAFLLRNNGCLPDGMVSVAGFDVDVSEFYPLYDPRRSSRATVIHWNRDLIWFAGDSGGGEYGIAHTGACFGQVFWFDTPHSEILEPGPGDARKVAQTFDAFIASIDPMS
ncbi:SMI1/KNR4 family protein [Pararhodobacter zhoushanensis]|uniref:SMI1/KNR4 family protein n=1 Tax=Pararhodobacter zhoushanensis TaxID=2479545 RepID=A0ABT3H3Q8_9RHOB|nr:SMI1/KNR4 family protein [Pararhodobacter zhoushanensis]MCW1934396.1 SMI1/KNR4 family protein [Pararhodobacter zhoushanensis]